MATMNVSLPEGLRGFVETRVTKGGYGTVSEYIRELVRADQKQRAQEELEERLLAALDSGTPIAITPEYIKNTLAELLAQQEGRGQ